MINNKNILFAIIVGLSLLVIILSLLLLKIKDSLINCRETAKIKINRIEDEKEKEIEFYKALNDITKKVINKKFSLKLKSKKHKNFFKNDKSFYFVFISNTKECPKCKQKYYKIFKETMKVYKAKQIGFFMIASYTGSHVSSFYISEENIPTYFIRGDKIKKELGTEDFTVILYIDRGLKVIDIYKPICKNESMRRFKRWVKEKCLER